MSATKKRPEVIQRVPQERGNGNMRNANSIIAMQVLQSTQVSVS